MKSVGEKGFSQLGRGKGDEVSQREYMPISITDMLHIYMKQKNS